MSPRPGRFACDSVAHQLIEQILATALTDADQGPEIELLGKFINASHLSEKFFSLKCVMDNPYSDEALYVIVVTVYLIFTR